ncbi:MAG: hypothetical protein ACP6IY_19330 [Promethearchaeia archaeon]
MSYSAKIYIEKIKKKEFWYFRLVKRYSPRWNEGRTVELFYKNEFYGYGKIIEYKKLRLNETSTKELKRITNKSNRTNAVKYLINKLKIPDFIKKPKIVECFRIKVIAIK